MPARFSISCCRRWVPVIRIRVTRSGTGSPPPEPDTVAIVFLSPTHKSLLWTLSLSGLRGPDRRSGSTYGGSGMRLFFRAFGRKARQCVAIRRGVMAAPLILVQIVQVRVLAAELVNNMLSRAECMS